MTETEEVITEEKGDETSEEVSAEAEEAVAAEAGPADNAAEEAAPEASAADDIAGESSEDEGTPADSGEDAGDQAASGEDDGELFDPADDAADTRVADLEAELETVSKERDDFKGRLLRTAADYENFRKRSNKEKDDLKKYGADKVVSELLPVIDNLERALSHSEKTEANSGLVEGVEMVLKQFRASLEKFGVIGFDSIDEVFNPEVHEAIQQVTREDKPNGVVVEEYQRGYHIHERLLRPALVVVNKNPNG